MLCRWLEQHQSDPHNDVIISVIPPEQMVRNLSSGNIDGFCVGEPWNSLAVEEGIGWCPATSSQISFGYPEKVLATTERFYAYRPDEYLKMIEVLVEACQHCDAAEYRKALLKTLSKPQYLNCQPKTLEHAFSGSFDMGFGSVNSGHFIRFSGEGMNRPDKKRGLQVLKDLARFVPAAEINTQAESKLINSAYREDIFDEATTPVNA